MSAHEGTPDGWSPQALLDEAARDAERRVNAWVAEGCRLSAMIPQLASRWEVEAFIRGLGTRMRRECDSTAPLKVRP